MKPRVNIINLAVDDLHRALAFYRDGLGWTPHPLGEEFDHVAFDLQPGLSLVLFPRGEVAKLAGEAPVEPRSREVVLSHPAASPEEVDRILQMAVDAGASLPKPPEVLPWGYCGYFLDPDGHLWEILGDPGFAVDAE